MNHCVGGAPVIEDGLVKVLDMLWRELAELDVGGREVRDHPSLHHNGVALVGGRGDGGPDAAQPIPHVVRKRYLGLRWAVLGQYGLHGLLAGAGLLLVLILHPDLVQGLLSLAFACGGDRKLGGDPFFRLPSTFK